MCHYQLVKYRLWVDHATGMPDPEERRGARALRGEPRSTFVAGRRHDSASDVYKRNTLAVTDRDVHDIRTVRMWTIMKNVIHLRETRGACYPSPARAGILLIETFKSTQIARVRQSRRRSLHPKLARNCRDEWETDYCHYVARRLKIYLAFPLARAVAVDGK